MLLYELENTVIYLLICFCMHLCVTTSCVLHDFLHILYATLTHTDSILLTSEL